MAAATQTVSMLCPQCGWSGTFDVRFTSWCEQCGYNADPGRRAPVGRAGLRAERRQARGREREREQFERLRTAAGLRPDPGLAALGVGMSLVVHLLTLAMLLGACWVFEDFHGSWTAWVVVVLAVGIAVEVRPRLWRWLRGPKRRHAALDRAAAPELFALLDRCAEAIGSPKADFVAFTAAFNAGTYRSGLGRRVHLEIGVPLWTVLDRGERLALLGHELGHQANGDFTRTFWGATARESLLRWRRIFDPRLSRSDLGFVARGATSPRGLALTSSMASFGTVLLPIVLPILFSPIYLILWCLSAIQRRLDLRQSQRAEYLADELSARLASSDAAVRSLERLALADSVAFYLRGRRLAHGDPDKLWAGLLAYLASVPDHEKRRRVHLQKVRGTRIDSTHPATYLRAGLVAARERRQAAVTVADADWELIEKELEPSCLALARTFL